MRSISNKLLLAILIFSSFVTMVITSFQLFVEYEEGQSSIEKELEYIKDRQTDPLAYAVWTLNQNQVEAIAKGILYSSNISYIRVSDPDTNFVVEYGDFAAPKNKVVSHVLSYHGNTISKGNVGTLTLHVSYRALYSHLKKRVLFVLLGQTIKTFLVSFFILWLVGVLLIKDLNMMADFFGKLEFPRDTGKTFPKRHRPVRDEFDILTDSFNDMTLRLDNSYKQIREWNDGLESIVAQRMVDIRQLQEKNAHLIRVLCHDMANSSMAIGLVESKLRRVLKLFPKSTAQEIEITKLTKSLRANSKRQQEILKQVRDVVLATDNEKILVDFREISIDRLFSEVIQNFQEQLREKNIEIKKIIRGRCQKVLVDYSVFKNNILSNLLSNAIKYSYEGGSIDLLFHSTSNSQYISVINYGRIMPSEEIGTILSLERVMSRPGTKGENGSGLGLLIVQKCLQAHNGHLEIIQGSVDHPYVEFRLNLPLSEVSKEVIAREVRA